MKGNVCKAFDTNCQTAYRLSFLEINQYIFLKLDVKLVHLTTPITVFEWSALCANQKADSRLVSGYWRGWMLVRGGCLTSLLDSV